MNDYLEGMPRPRGRPTLSDQDDTIRKSVSLPASLWDAVNEARRQWSGKVPTESEVFRVLVREALEARGVSPQEVTSRRQKKGKDQGDD
jgi:Arc/MetJ-type ribon-helix-helix transcriptional regulator